MNEKRLYPSILSHAYNTGTLYPTYNSNFANLIQSVKQEGELQTKTSMSQKNLADENRLETSQASSTTINDETELEAGGYKGQMPRQFTTFGLISLSFALSTPWSGIGSSMGISLVEASSAGTIWSMPVAAFGTAILSAGMAELASAYPVAGAQYYWSFMVSSEQHRAFAAYV